MLSPIRLTPVVKSLLLACVVLFVVQKTADQFFGANLLGLLGLVPTRFVFGFHFWQIFSYVFLHADVGHLVLNGLMLVFLGSELEALWGPRRFLQFFFASAFAAGVLFLVLVGTVWQEGVSIPLVGASGGIYGLLLAYGILFAERQMLFMMIFPMKAKHFVLLLGGVELMTTLYAAQPGAALSSIAHLGGMLGGWAYLVFAARWSQRLTSRHRSEKTGSKRKPSSSHLKLVVTSSSEEASGTKKSSSTDDGSRDPKSWN